MILNYVSLGILFMGLLLLFYGFIYIHDIPYKIAKKRHHPHQEAIHVACWVSLFTLHAIWPIVYVWSVYKSRPLLVSIVAENPAEAVEMQQQIASLREQIRILERTQSQPKDIES